MKDLCVYILKFLVTKPEDMTVDETENEFGQVILTVKVAKEDMGRVIGKNGKIINSLRDVIKILALKLDKHADIVLSE